MAAFKVEIRDHFRGFFSSPFLHVPLNLNKLNVQGRLNHFFYIFLKENSYFHGSILDLPLALPWRDLGSVLLLDLLCISNHYLGIQSGPLKPSVN